MSFTIGSLFDGSGGFPLAGFLSGGVPLWASEIEPYPIAVTKSRFPMMKHLGSVTDIKGNEVDPVDVITFGSPCQDLSVAGKRAGLKHEDNGDEETTRSGLFMEAIRIIREMREATNGVYPRIAVWENVPGAFSSNKGEDFRIVLEEFVKIKEPSAEMPAPDKNGWPYADYYVGDGWSVAYRTLDAQFWGVPQRRRRIYLVADFGGERAGEILFEREGLRGYFAEGRTPWKAVTRDAADCTGTADCKRISDVIPINTMIATRHKQLGRGTGFGLGEIGDAQFTISAGHEHAVCYGISPYHSNSMLSDNPHSGIYIADTSRTLDLNGGNPCCNQGECVAFADVAATLRAGAGAPKHEADFVGRLVAQPIVESLVLDDQGGSQINVRTDGKSPTLRAEMHGNIPAVLDVPYTLKIRSGCEGGGKGALIQTDMSATLATNNDQYLFQPICIENHPADSRVNIDDSGKVQTLTSRMGTGGGNVPMVMEPKHAYCLQGSMIGRADQNGPQGDGVNEDQSFTLNTIDRHAVAYCLGNGQANQGYSEEVSGALNCMHDQQAVCYAMQGFGDYKDATNLVVEQPIVLDRAFYNQGANAQYDPQFYEDGTCPTLVARGPAAVCTRYIVRRLTPTECARLQGFPDKWGHPDIKDELTDEEYEFWLNVRNTHAEINGKAVKQYTKAQMLTWYNKLHTDSSEYKMWGIALPNALYVMQGIADVLVGV